MIVNHNVGRTELVLGQMRASFGLDVRDGIHLSDLLNPRKSAWQRVLPMPLTNDEVLYFTAGRGHEDALGRIAGLDSTPQKFFYIHELASGPETQRTPISYRPDFMWQGLKTEFKTRRANLAQPGEETVVYDNYLDQILGYCALDNDRHAVLMCFSLLEGRSGDPLNPTHPEIRVYDVEFTQLELDNKMVELLERRSAFEAEMVAHSMEQIAAAVGGRRPVPAASTLPLCKPWMCGKPRKVVDTPTYCRQCVKEINHRPGHVHLSQGYVDAEAAHWEYEPRCKYYAVCRPQDTDPTRGAR